MEAGLLIDNNIVARTGQPGYNVFGKYSIVFALRGNHNQVTGLYFRSTVNNKKPKALLFKRSIRFISRLPETRNQKAALNRGDYRCGQPVTNP